MIRGTLNLVNFSMFSQSVSSLVGLGITLPQTVEEISPNTVLNPIVPANKVRKLKKINLTLNIQETLFIFVFTSFLFQFALRQIINKILNPRKAVIAITNKLA